MKSPEQYIPTPEETKKAEDMMSDSQKEKSEKRENNWEYQVERKVKGLESILERYKAEFKTLEFSDNAPADVRREILYVKDRNSYMDRIPKLSFIGIFPFQETRHWGSGIDADGVLREDLNLWGYANPNGGGIYEELSKPVQAAFSEAWPIIEKLAEDFNSAREEIAKKAGVTLPENEIPIEKTQGYGGGNSRESQRRYEEYKNNNPGRLTYWNENTIKFYETQWAPENRNLIKQIIADMEEILKKVKEK